jgi:tyrosinase
MVWQYEETLINECNYQGAQPYWDWSIDTPENGKHFHESVIWDPVIGFGGNGEDGFITKANTAIEGLIGSCVRDGPFAEYTYNLGPEYNYDKPNPHCLVRNWNYTWADDAFQWNQNIVPLLELTNYTEFYKGMTTAPKTVSSVFRHGLHSGGHSGIGGEMQNPWSSTNDPIFFMHHAGIDWIWSVWQSLSEENANALSGPIYPNGTGTVNLTYPIYFAPFIAQDVTIEAVMDTEDKNGKGVLCYIYEDAGHPLPKKQRNQTVSRIERRRQNMLNN